MANKRKNYFSDNIQRFGDNFLQQYDAKKLRNDSPRIIKDIAFGNIDFDEYGIYFSDPQLINALIDVVYTKLTIHRVSYNALEYMSRDMSNSDIESIKRYHRRLVEAYQLFYDYFKGIEMSGYSGESISQLKALSTRARDYAQDLIEPVFSDVRGSTASVYANPAIQNMYTPQQETVQTVTNQLPAQQESQIHPIEFNFLTSEQAKKTRLR